MERKYKAIAVAAFLIIFSCLVFSATPEDLSWDGSTQVNLSKTSFSDNEPITGTVTVYNTQEYPLIGGKIIIQLAEGTYEYPSQDNPNDNIFFEQIVPFNWVLPKSSKTFSFILPAQKAGSYRMDVYSWVIKSKFIGASNILYSPISKQLTITGNSSIVRAQINRSLSMFNDSIGPIGFPAKSGEEITGEIIIVNNSQKEKTNLKLGIIVCDWAEMNCEESKEIYFDIPSIPANSNKVVYPKFNAPIIPSAYLINMKVYDGNEINSIYKNRIIISQGTAKIRKIFILGLDSKNYSINTLLSGSPDHFTYPTFNNFVFGLELFKENLLVEEQTKQISSLKAGEIIEENIALTSKQFDKICAKVTSNQVVFEEECFDVPLTEIQTEYDEVFPKVVDVNWVYDEGTKTLKFSLKKDQINAFVKIFSTEKTLYSEGVSTSNIFEKSIVLPKENLYLSVDDLDAKQQQLFTLNLAVPIEKQSAVEVAENPVTKEQTELATCKGSVCSTGFTCTIDTFNSKDGACCSGECIQQVQTEEEGTAPLILWIALIIVTIAAIVVFNSINKVKRK